MNNIKTVFFMTLMGVIFLALGYVAGGRSGMTFALVFAIGINVFSYWFSDSMVLRMYNAREVGSDSRLYHIVQDLAKHDGLPVPRVYVIASDVPNAFATGRSPSHAAVAATEGILTMLDDEEIRGVLAHEMSHIKHRDILISTIVATFATAVSYLANILQWAAIFGGGRDNDDENGGGGGIIGLLASIIIAPLAATMVQLAVSRTREYMADDAGGRLTGDPLALASALAKIDAYAHRRVLPGATESTAHMCIINPFAGVGSGIAKLFSTHPSTQDRIARLQKLDRELHSR